MSIECRSCDWSGPRNRRLTNHRPEPAIISSPRYTLDVATLPLALGSGTKVRPFDWTLTAQEASLLDAPLYGCVLLYLRAFFSYLTEISTGAILHHEVKSIGVGEVMVERNNRWMVKAREKLHFAEKIFLPVSIFFL